MRAQRWTLTVASTIAGEPDDILIETNYNFYYNE